MPALGDSPSRRAATATMRCTLRAASARMYSTGRAIRDGNVALKRDAPVLLQHPVAEVRGAGRRLGHPDALELAGRAAEQRRARAEQDRRDMDLQLVEQA